MPYWLYLLMVDVNALRGRPVFNADRWFRLFAVILGIYLALIFIGDFVESPLFWWLGIAATAALVLSTTIAIVMIDGEIRTLDGSHASWLSALGAVLLTVLFYLSAALLQARINRLNGTPVISRTAAS